jgi:hypothetical protein
MTFRSLGPPDAIINAEAGAIINSIRSSLDLLFVAVVGRNGMKFNRDVHFPIRRKATDFLSEIKAMETKQVTGAKVWAPPDFSLAPARSSRFSTVMCRRHPLFPG